MVIGVYFEIEATVKKQIDPFPISLCIVPTHTIHSFMQK